MMRFEFSTPNKIIFGSGSVGELGTLTAQYGSHVLLITTHKGPDPQIVVDSLVDRKITYHIYFISGEPDVEIIRKGTEIGREGLFSAIIGYGGGSVIDAGKAISAMITNPGDVMDYLEVVGKGQEILYSPKPYLAVPTTAGTGSEVTRNAVITVKEKAFKASLRSTLILPKVAIIDPDLTLSLPSEITATTGMDALTQVIEPYVSRRANPMTDMFCLDGLKYGSRAIRRAFLEGNDLEARSGMSWTSLMGGMALANAGLGAVHGFASPIGGQFPAPHGAVCARLLPVVVHANLKALRERDPQSLIIHRFTDIARILTGNKAANAEDCVKWISELCNETGIKGLSSYGITPEHIPSLVQSAKGASSMKANPVVLTDDELASILYEAL